MIKIPTEGGKSGDEQERCEVDGEGGVGEEDPPELGHHPAIIALGGELEMVLKIWPSLTNTEMQMSKSWPIF